MNKKIIAIVILIVISLMFAGCGFNRIDRLENKFTIYKNVKIKK